MLGFGEALHQKEPERVKAFLRSCDARIRGAGIYAEQNMVNLVHLLNSRADHDIYEIYDIYECWFDDGMRVNTNLG